MYCGFENSRWEHDGNGEFEISAGFAEIRKDTPQMARWKCKTETERKEKTYEFSVKYIMENGNGVLSAYAMVSLYKEDGSYIIRMYADNMDKEKAKKKCVFTVPKECTHIGIELGLKGRGYVKWSEPELKECTPIKERRVKIAATRLNAADTIRASMENIEKVVDKAGAQKVDIIVMSEVINDLGCGLSIEETAQTTDGEYCALMRKKAQQYNTYIVMNFHEKDECGYYNTSLLIDREGNIAGKYRKTHISFNECEHNIVPGDEFPVFETDFGKVGMLICWDMYFPEPARIMALKGVELILVSTVGDPAFRHISRAMENGVYVAVSGSQYHNLNDCHIKPSKIIAPDGKILAQTDEVGSAAVAEVDLSDKKQMYWLSTAASFSIPGNIYKNERRPELYNEI